MLALLLQTAYQDLLILKQSAVSINCGRVNSIFPSDGSNNVRSSMFDRSKPKIGCSSSITYR